MSLQIGDVVSILINEQDLPRAQLLLGEEVTINHQLSWVLVEDDVEITEKSLVGHSLAELALQNVHHVFVTKIRRQGIEFVARGTSTLDFGDQLRIIGTKHHVESFVAFAGACIIQLLRQRWRHY